MAKLSNVPTKGSDFGKKSFANTSPVTVLYSTKSYHSIAVPIVLAMIARRSWTSCARSKSGEWVVRGVDAADVVIAVWTSSQVGVGLMDARSYPPRLARAIVDRLHQE